MSNWMTKEQDRVNNKSPERNEQVNPGAPTLIRQVRAPQRRPITFYLQPAYHQALADLAHIERRVTGRRRQPELIEEAIKALLKKYGQDVSHLK